MLTELFYNVFLPSLLFAVALSGLLYLMTAYRHKDLPRALAEGFAGSNYVLTHGLKGKAVSDFFYDLDLSVTDSRNVKPVLNFFISTIKEVEKREDRIDELAFIEKDSGPIGALTLLGALTEKLGIPSMIVRLRRRLDINSIKGVNNKKRGENVVLISDVATSGTSVQSAIDKIEMGGSKVLAVVVVVSRMKREDLERLRVPLYYACQVNDKSDLQRMPMRPFIERKFSVAAPSQETAKAA